MKLFRIFFSSALALFLFVCISCPSSTVAVDPCYRTDFIFEIKNDATTAVAITFYSVYGHEKESYCANEQKTKVPASGTETIKCQVGTQLYYMKYLSFLLEIGGKHYAGFSSADKLTDEKGAEYTFSATEANLGQGAFKWTGGSENDGTLQVVWRHNGTEETRECPSGHIAAYYTITITDSDIIWELEKVE